MLIESIHHVAIIASDYRKSVAFYCDILGFELVAEHYRQDSQSWKADLALCGHYVVELFSFPESPPRLTRPEARGLRHLAFTVVNIEQAIAHLAKYDIVCEPIRIDPYTGRRFSFFYDPDQLPLELYEQ